ncbi:MAG: hypothetical protein AB1489_25515 [Acidobacteriota bacterium]
MTTCQARSEKVVVAHVVLVCIAYTFMQLLKPLASKHRPSVGSTIKTIAPLLVVLDSHQIVRPLANGSFQVACFDDLVSVLRTAFPQLPCPENPLIS